MKIIKSRYIVSFLLILTMLFGALPASALDLVYSELVNLPGLDLPIDESLMIEHGSIVFEAEDIMIAGMGVSAVADAKASGGVAVNMPSTKWYIEETPGDQIASKIYVGEGEEIGSYKIWYRARTTHSDSGSAWLNPNTDIWAANYYSSLRDGEYRWTSANIILHEGENYFAFRTRTSGLIDKIVITNNMSFKPTGADDVPIYMTPEEEEALWRTYWKQPEITPIEGHPRLLITSVNKEQMRERINASWRKDSFYKYAYEDIDCKLDTTKANNHNAMLLSKIMGRALVWVMGDETNPAHAKQTIQHMKDYLETVRTPDDTGDITRSRGNILYTAAIVYDWCYDQLTEEDKEYFIDAMIKVVHSKEVGWPPVIGGNLSGHTGEMEVFRDLVGAGIALYDEYPLLYDLAAGKMFQEMVPARKFFRDSGRVSYGHDYSLARGYSEAWADWQIQCMGYPSIYGDELATKWWSWRLDARMPYGAMIPDGDMYSLRTQYHNYYYADYIQAMGLAANLYKDPYLMQEFDRTLINHNVGEYDKFFIMLFHDDSIPSEIWDERNLSNVTTYPQSGFVAKTSWQEGFNSDAAMAFVDMHELWVGDHQHNYTGDFQIYYKGLLTMNTGVYNSSNQHNEGYSHRGIAANTMLVYDPDETFKAAWGADSFKVTNDGGQRTPPYGTGPNYMSDYQFDDNMVAQNRELVVAEDVKAYSGPNKKTPEFTYISGDLTNAYTAKVTDYERSTVFIDLNNDKYPAAFVVYDKIDSSNKDFRKVWLLHSEEKPTITGNTTTITRTEDGFGGKLVNKTLTPAASNQSFNVVGGDNNEMYELDGNMFTPTANTREAGKYRIELSPRNAAKADTFLNAMYVTDAGTTEELPMTKIDQGKFTGVMVMDKQVFFSKDTTQITDKFSMNIRDNGYTDNGIMIADIAPGVWTVSGNGITQNIEVTAESGILVFHGAAGKYDITPAAAGVTADNITYEEMSKRKVGDFYVWVDDENQTDPAYGSFIRVDNPTKRIDGKTMIAVNTLTELGIAVTPSGNSADITAGEYTTTLTEGINTYNVGTEVRQLSVAPKYIDGALYIYPQDLAMFLGYEFVDRGSSNILTVTMKASS